MSFFNKSFHSFSRQGTKGKRYRLLMLFFLVFSLSFCFVFSEAATNVRRTAIFAKLGDDRSWKRPDRDDFIFEGETGEEVIISLDAGKEKKDGKVILLVLARISGIKFSHSVNRDIPLKTKITLPKTGSYNIAVIQNFGLDNPMRTKNKGFKGDYFISLESSSHAHETLQAGPTVE